MKNILKITMIMATITAFSFAAKAQPGAGGFDQENDTAPAQEPDVPVDGGVILLAAAGAAYGYKKMKLVAKISHK